MTSIDLNNCDKEKIHHISCVQGHGAFVAVTPLDMAIHHASENVGEFFKQTEDVHYYIGKRLHDLVTNSLVLDIQKKIRFGFTGQLATSEFDIYIFKLHDNVFGLEFERKNIVQSDDVMPERFLTEFIQKIHQLKTFDALSFELCRSIRLLTGMERVMLYRFYSPTMYGEVIAEDRIAEAHSFMGHRFPPTDIPKPARDLYLRNQVRFIYDSHDKDSEIYPKIVSRNTPLDMSDSRLRGVSRIHTEYMKNMGVRTSLSVAIIVDGELWGLIACHNKEPLQVEHHVRSLGLALSSSYALAASMMEKNQAQQKELLFFNQLHALFSDVKQSPEPLKQLFLEGDKVLKIFSSTGMALITGPKYEFYGITPLPADIKEIEEVVLDMMDKRNKTVFATECLSELDEKFISYKEQASGVLAIKISELSNRLLLFFRPELLETIQWGGDPRKNLEARDYGGTINPRKSFETWTEVVKNNSQSWSQFEVEGIKSFRNLFFDALINKDELVSELQEQLKRK